MLNTGNRVCLFFSFFQVCVCLFNVLSAIQSPINPPSFSSPCLPSLPTFFTSADLLLKKRVGSLSLMAVSLCNRKCPTTRASVRLASCVAAISFSLTHSHTRWFRSCYTNTSPSTTCPGQGSDRIIPGKERKEAVQFAVFWASQPGSVKKQLSLKHRRLHRESLCYFRRVFLMDDWSRLFPPFTHFLFILLLTPSSPCSLSFSYLFLPFSSFSPLSSFFHPNVFFFSFLTLLFLCVLHLHFYILCSHFFFTPFLKKQIKKKKNLCCTWVT